MTKGNPCGIKNVFRAAMVLGLMGTAGYGCASHRASSSSRHAEPQAIHEKVYFEFGRSSVRPEDEDLLGRVASQLKNHGKTITVLEGHSDQVGEAQFNEILAEERARAVRVYLRDQGVEPHQITVTSKGEREPLVTGHGHQTLQPNRRVDIRFLLTGEER